MLVKDDGNARDVTLTAKNLTLRQAIAAVADQAGVRWEIRPASIMFYTGGGSGSISLRSYKVPAGFLTTTASTLGETDSSGDPFATGGNDTKPKIRRLGAREFLESVGVAFPEGTSASYSPGVNQLTVRNTEENLDIIADYIEGLVSKTPRQVRLRIALLSASEVALQELGVDNVLGQFALGNSGVFGSGGTGGNAEIGGTANSPGNFGNTTFNPITVPFPVTQGLMFGGLRSTFELNKVQTITDLINISSAGGSASQQNRSPAFFTFGGIFTSPQFQTMLRGLNQKKSIDFSVANDVVIKSGQKASSFSGRELPYPTEFDPPQIPQTVTAPQFIDLNTLNIFSGSLGSVPITPTTPSSFETKKVGSEIEVEATVSEDGSTVEVNLSAIVSEFDGFINYGTPILDTVTQTVATENRIVQPVFSKTAASAQVLVYDGATVAIGGLTEAKYETVEDKTPIFASIPVIGRLWKSNVARQSRKSLVYFITVNVIDPSGSSRSERAELESASTNR